MFAAVAFAAAKIVAIAWFMSLLGTYWVATQRTIDNARAWNLEKHTRGLYGARALLAIAFAFLAWAIAGV